MAEGAPVLALQGEARCIVAVDADLSGSSFSDVALRGAAFRDADLSAAVLENVTLAGARVRDADLRGCVVEACRMEGMTIDGVAVSALFAAWRGRAGGDEPSPPDPPSKMEPRLK